MRTTVAWKNSPKTCTESTPVPCDEHAATKSNAVLKELGSDVQWLESYVVDDKLYCVYNADSPKIIEEHAKCGGFPVNKISRVSAIMDPTTAEA